MMFIFDNRLGKIKQYFPEFQRVNVSNMYTFPYCSLNLETELYTQIQKKKVSYNET